MILICNIYRKSERIFQKRERERVIAMFEDRISAMNVPVFEWLCICMKMCKNESFKAWQWK